MDDQLTTAGSVLGKPAYMAPEQERGEAVDQRADVFAIGAMLWELCSLQKVPPSDLAQRHRMLRRAGIDHDLIVIIDKAIDPEARSRYRDAGALAADLKAFKSGARITARDYSLPAMLAHWTRRHRALAVALVSFVVLLLASVAGLTGLYRSSSRNAEDAQRNASAAHDLLIQSYTEQGRRALLDGKHSEALAYLVAAAERGGDSPGAAFMRERAATPLSAEVLRIRSTTPRMWSAAFSPDGSRLATSDDAGAEAWDVPSARLLFSLPHTNTVFLVLYSLDGKQLVTFGADSLVKIWAADNGALIRVLSSSKLGGSAFYRTGALSPDGRMVAAFDRNTATAYVWSIETGALLATLPNRGTAAARIGFSGDGRWLATSAGEEVRVFDTMSWKPTRALPVQRVLGLRFDRTRPWLITGSGTGDVSVWDVASGQRVRHLREMGAAVLDVTWSGDGAMVAAIIEGGESAIWRAGSGQVQARWESSQRSATSIEFDTSSTHVVTGNREGNVMISDAQTGIAIASFEGSGRPNTAVHFDSSTRFVVGAAIDGTARVWSVAASERRWTSPEIGRDCGRNVSERDRRFVVVPCTDHAVQVWDTARDQLLAELPSSTIADGDFEGALPSVSAAGELAAIARGNDVEVYRLPRGRRWLTIHHAAPVTAIRFASHGGELVTASADGSVRVTGEDGETRALPSSHSAVDAAAFLPDGRLIVADADRRMTFYDVQRGLIVNTLVLPTRIVMICVSSDGDRLVTIPVSARPAPPGLWDVPQAAMIAQLDGHGSQVFSAQFVHGGHEVLTAGTDGTARRWDGDNGLLRQTYLAPPGLFDAVFSPDGKLLVGAGADGVLRFWDAASGDLLSTLRAHKSYISGVHFEGDALITRAFTGEMSRWQWSSPPAFVASQARLERLVGCGRLRFDPSTGRLVAQSPLACDAQRAGAGMVGGRER